MLIFEPEMTIKDAKFISSHASLAKLPPQNMPEFAFIGRSNVGKSSLINMLCGRKDLAKTSQTPGKTQTINHFLINELWYLVDLPGYGYAKTSKKLKHEWAGFTFEYLKKRTNLLCTFVLIDVRHEPQKLDIALMEWLSEKQIPFVIVFTKCDKLTTNHVNAHVASYKNYMLESWESLPEIFMTSAEKNKGKEHILEFIEQVIENTTL